MFGADFSFSGTFTVTEGFFITLLLRLLFVVVVGVLVLSMLTRLFSGCVFAFTPVFGPVLTPAGEPLNVFLLPLTTSLLTAVALRALLITVTR